MRKLVLAAVLSATVFSCAEPVSREQFVLKEDAQSRSRYSFALDFSDSAASYGISFYTRIERGAFKPFRSDSVRLNVRWTSPSDSSWSEIAVIPLKAAADSAYFFKDYIAPFKGRFVPFEAGAWKLDAVVSGDYESLRGLGVVCRREEAE